MRSKVSRSSFFPPSSRRVLIRRGLYAAPVFQRGSSSSDLSPLLLFFRSPLVLVLVSRALPQPFFLHFIYLSKRPPISLIRVIRTTLVFPPPLPMVVSPFLRNCRAYNKDPTPLIVLEIKSSSLSRVGLLTCP